jgi:murein L,D-transpeptidase YafK
LKKLKGFILIPVLLLVTLAVANWPRKPMPAEMIADQVIVEKRAHKLVLLRKSVPLKTYHIALGRGGIDDKTCEGDNRTPEGIYTIDSRNAQSRFYRSLHVSYPDARHIAGARQLGCNAGGAIMVHGIPKKLGWLGKLHRLIDWTAGCIAVTNEEIDEIWRAVPNGTPIVIQP